MKLVRGLRKFVLRHFALVKLEEAKRAGDAGELRVIEAIRRIKPAVHIQSALLPLRDNQIHKEFDNLFMDGGILFVVEVKNYKGLVSRSETPGQLRVITRSRRGNFYEKRRKDPAYQTDRYLSNLRRFLTRIDRRFDSVRIVPVYVFSREADLGDLHTPGSGFIYDDELFAFVMQQKRSFTHTHSHASLEAGLRNVPRADTVLQIDGSRLTGIIEGEEFKYRSRGDKRWHQWHWKDIAQIRVESRGGLFESSDTLQLFLHGGGTTTVDFDRSARIRLLDYTGKCAYSIPLLNVRQIDPSPVRIKNAGARARFNLGNVFRNAFKFVAGKRMRWVTAGLLVSALVATIVLCMLPESRPKVQFVDGPDYLRNEELKRQRALKSKRRAIVQRHDTTEKTSSIH